MAQKRMFSLQVIDTDKFMDMPSSTQALYFHLGMHGDDDGFVSSPRKIARAAGCSDDDMRLLVAKGFIIPFDSGVVVVTDWKINNTLKNDRYSETIYQAEKSMLTSEKSGRYSLGSTLVPECFQVGSGVEPQHNITKHNKEEHNEEKSSKADKPPRSRFVPPSVDEVKRYCMENGYGVDGERFVSYYESNGWMVGRNKMKSWKAAVRNWATKEQDKPGKQHQESGIDKLARIYEEEFGG